MIYSVSTAWILDDMDWTLCFENAGERRTVRIRRDEGCYYWFVLAKNICAEGLFCGYTGLRKLRPFQPYYRRWWVQWVDYLDGGGHTVVWYTMREVEEFMRERGWQIVYNTYGKNVPSWTQGQWMPSKYARTEESTGPSCLVWYRHWPSAEAPLWPVRGKGLQDHLILDVARVDGTREEWLWSINDIHERPLMHAMETYRSVDVAQLAVENVVREQYPTIRRLQSSFQATDA